MRGLTMDYPLTLAAVARRAEALYGDRPVVSRRADRALHRTTYREVMRRARRLAAALRRSASAPATASPRSAGTTARTSRPTSPSRSSAACSTPSTSASTPTSSPTSSTTPTTAPCWWTKRCCRCWEQVRAAGRRSARDRRDRRRRAGARAAMLDYEALIAADAEPPADLPDPDERDAAAMCYTSGTTGKPEGCRLLAPRARAPHAGAAHGRQLRASARRHVLPVVPMFHANAWGMPFTAAMIGAKLVMPGPAPRSRSIVDLCQRERVTITGGVPDDLDGRAASLDAQPGRVRSVRASARCRRRRGRAASR